MAKSGPTSEEPVPPESSEVAVAANDGATASRTQIANDALLKDAQDESTTPVEETSSDADAGAKRGEAKGEEPEAPASAPRAKSVALVEPIPPSSSLVPVPADPTEMPLDEPALSTARMKKSDLVKPLLASEALMEDLAPVEPSRDVARLWCAVVGVGFAALGILPLVGLRPGGAQAAGFSFFLGGVALVAALTKVSYRQRAYAMLVLGLLVVLTGLGGTGPAAFIARDTAGLGLARAFAAIALPGALLFRARYRAYAGARWALGAAFVLALPFVGLIAWRLLTHEADLSTAGAIVALVVTLVGLVGFMGKETTGAGTYVGLSVLVGLGTELFLLDISHAGVLDAWSTIITTALGSAAFIAATGLAALGLFQVLASRLSGEARQIDLHAVVPEPQRVRTNKSEWTE